MFFELKSFFLNGGEILIIERIEKLCLINNTTLTALCKEITGSSGNLPTWKKDNIKPIWLKKICLKFNISSDYLLDIPSVTTNPSLNDEEQQALERFRRLNSDNRITAQSKMIELYNSQNNPFVATDELLITGTDSLGK